MDRWDPKHVELTYVMNKTHSLKKHFVYLVGLHIYIRTIINCFRHQHVITSVDVTKFQRFQNQLLIIPDMQHAAESFLFKPC